MTAAAIHPLIVINGGFGLAVQHVETYPTRDRTHPCSLQWEHGVSTTGTPGKSDDN